MNKNAFSISIMIIGLILIFLLFSIFGILYFYWGNAKAVQDSLSTTGSIFGAIATLGAAYVAVHLYNDWREQLTSTVQQELARNILFSINKILTTLDDYGTFVLLHSGMGHEPEYLKEASRKATTLINDYPELALNLKFNLVSYEETFLCGNAILTEEEIQKLTGWYYYGLINILRRIIEKEHLQKPENFNIYLNNLRRDRKIFQELRKKINNEMIPKINIKS